MTRAGGSHCYCGQIAKSHMADLMIELNGSTGARLQQLLECPIIVDEYNAYLGYRLRHFSGRPITAESRRAVEKEVTRAAIDFGSSYVLHESRSFAVN